MERLTASTAPDDLGIKPDDLGIKRL